MLSEKIYGNCPCCGSNLQIYSADDGTNSFVSVDAKELSLLQSERDSLKTENEDLRANREADTEMLNRYIDRCRYYESIEIPRYRKALEKISVANLTMHDSPLFMRDIARTALESSQPEGREVTVEALEILIETVWADIAKTSIATGNMYKAETVVSEIVTRLLEVFDIRKREG